RGRWGMGFGQAPMADALWECLTDAYCSMPMAMTAEKLAEQHGIGREACDAYALRSQKAYGAAWERGAFAAEIAPIELPSRKGPVTVSKDECPRVDSNAQGLARLKPVFKKDGVVTAGNASAITDGAAALVLTTKARAEALGAPVLAWLRGWAFVGVDPTVMGIGPVGAVQQALAATGLSLSEIGLVEV
ncbi:MAG: thiolase family protein, partial [Bdellovibrionales bacterium]|nr:thiolase family protein [Bdellovibrionales bacterium]